VVLLTPGVALNVPGWRAFSPVGLGLVPPKNDWAFVIFDSFIYLFW
jgi:hypothetical protein